LRPLLKRHSNSVETVAFSPNGRLLASGSDDKTVKLWNSATGELIQRLEGHNNWVMAVAFCLDGRLLALALADDTVRLRNLAMGELI